MKLPGYLKAINWVKYAEIAISCLLLLLFLLPQAQYYVVEDWVDGGPKWENGFLTDDIFWFALHVPFLVAWMAYSVFKRSIYRKGFLLFSFFYCLGLCALYFLSASMMVMDILPALGLGIPFLIFGCLVVLVWDYLPRPKLEEEIEEN